MKRYKSTPGFLFEDGDPHALATVLWKTQCAALVRQANLAIDLLAACEAAYPMLILARHAARKIGDIEAAERLDFTVGAIAKIIAAEEGVVK